MSKTKDILYTCSVCEKDYPRRDVKIINKTVTCNGCVRKKRKEHREFLRKEIIKVRKRRTREELEREKGIKPPKMKGKKEIKVSRNVHFYITKEEKGVLYRKYESQGLNPQEVNKKVKFICEKMQEFVNKLREKKLRDEEISTKFREEFAKLISE
jgi:hypothetical protein